jgi:anthranilate 1,2-dioxygenase large subunit/terephthalate 1,2-dioxygenase oxygenase component alpha subunit
MLQRTWPSEGATRVPYWVYQDEDLYREEQAKIWRGDTWSYLCLEAELPAPKSFVTTFVGDMPVVVTRDAQGELHAWENRCAHRGALVCMQPRGSAERFSCIYHNWTYDHAGNLTNVAFRKGIGGKGGMPLDANPESQAPKQFRVSSLNGLVFGTLSNTVADLETYVGPEVLPRLKRVLKKPLKVLGAYTQVLPNNWKLYMDNTKDTYHASLLHLFFTRFRINRLTQGGGVLVSQDGAHHCTYTEMVEDKGDAYERGGMRSAGTEKFSLESPEVLHQVDEFGDRVSIQILTLFPGFVQRGVAGSPERASVIEMGGASVGSGDSRLTETAVRGLWKTWRRHMQI